MCLYACFIQITLSENICFPFELVYLKVDISHSVGIFFMSERQACTVLEFRAQVHRDWDGRKRILFAFIILQKCNVLLLLWVHTNKCRVFTDSKDVLFLSVWPTWRSILGASDRTGASICPAVSALLFIFHTPHKHLNSAHFSRLTLDWAAM